MLIVATKCLTAVNLRKATNNPFEYYYQTVTKMANYPYTKILRFPSSSGPPITALDYTDRLKWEGLELQGVLLGVGD